MARKLGIPTPLVRSWSDGTGQPNTQQLEVLAKFFEIEPPKLGAFATPIVPPRAGKKAGNLPD
jgi:hypothetical protein